MRQVKTLGLLGTGVIGGGWAARALHYGINVVAADEFGTVVDGTGVAGRRADHYRRGSLGHGRRVHRSGREHRDRRRPEDRRFAMTYDLREPFADVGVPRADPRVLRPEVRNHSLLVLPFVVPCVLEANPEGPQAVVEMPADNRRDQGRIQPSADVTPDRDIRAKTDADGVDEGATVVRNPSS